ncbi:MAG: hypothetical protein JWM74_991 [Myxococcaceae bacterium]|jgi:hypothetical protein|nr:hypothetical protein [Myxococcaceae bacterium]
MDARLRKLAPWVTWLVVAAVVAVVVRSRMAAEPVVRPPTGDASELRVPRASASVTLDGELTDRAWTEAPGRTGGFRDASGAEGRPYSEMRVVAFGEHLYLALFAADEDIRATRTAPDSPLWLEDAFHLTLEGPAGDFVIDVAPNGVVTDGKREGEHIDYRWSSNVRLAHDIDGTVNDPSDDDEEWVIEMELPFAALGLHGRSGERMRFSVRRCDKPKDAPQSCASWGDGEKHGVLVIE